MMSQADRLSSIADRLGIKDFGAGVHRAARIAGGGPELVTHDPTTGEVLGRVRGACRDDYDAIVADAQARFEGWRRTPAPKRGALIRRLGELLRQHKEALGELVSLEVGKIRSEGLGEVQEMIDICELAVGLSRQLTGLTIASERAEHRMMEQWHPLGPVGVVTAFNFPVAVWAWNAALAAVCGDPVIWKPSPHAPLCAVAVQHLAELAMEAEDAHGVFTLAAGGHEVGEWMADDPRLPLLSFTGSTLVGRRVAARVAERLGRSLLELGGNNAIVVARDADLDLAVRAIAFGAVGTAGQRCTTTRRLFVDHEIADELVARLVRAYGALAQRIGDPLDPNTLVGPLINEGSVKRFEQALEKARWEGGEIVCGGKRIDRPGHFVEPTIVRGPSQEQLAIAREETFGPILYVFEVGSVEEAIAANNAVSQGLSSAIFTGGVRASETFVGPAGSDCGIANVNIGTSGAEIGGAFGGEKDTGGGRESGSDSWKAYMRRQTCTVNYGRELPLAQGVEFL